MIHPDNLAARFDDSSALPEQIEHATGGFVTTALRYTLRSTFNELESSFAESRLELGAHGSRAAQFEEDLVVSTHCGS